MYQTFAFFDDWRQKITQQEQTSSQILIAYHWRKYHQQQVIKLRDKIKKQLKLQLNLQMNQHHLQTTKTEQKSANRPGSQRRRVLGSSNSGRSINKSSTAKESDSQHNSRKNPKKGAPQHAKTNIKTNFEFKRSGSKKFDASSLVKTSSSNNSNMTPKSQQFSF